MPYSGGTRLPMETASKLGHLTVVQSPWVKALVHDFERVTLPDKDSSQTLWQPINVDGVALLSAV